MKRFLSTITIIFVAIAAVISISAFTPAEGIQNGEHKTVVKNFNFKDFTSLEVSSFYKVYLTKGASFSISIEVENRYAENVVVSKTGSTLKIGMNKEVRKKKDEIYVARITMPVLKGVALSGVAELKTKDCFELSGEHFKVQLSGASEIDRLSVNAACLKIQMSGASEAEINGEFNEMKAVLSGSSQFDGKLKIANAARIELSGSAEVELEGKGSSLNAECSGSSKIDADEFTVESADVKLSGVSKAELMVSKKLNVVSSGASRCEYQTPTGSNIQLTKDCSGVSSVSFDKD